jgi:hypothetical protein
VKDDDKGTVAKALLRTLVRFGHEVRRCREWINKPPAPRCTVCQRWGHRAFGCYSNNPYCGVCAEAHPTAAHVYSCKTKGCADHCVCEIERCANCNGTHAADSNHCPFFLARYNPAAMKALLDQKRKDHKENAPVTDSWTTVSKGKRPARHASRMDIDPSTSAS